jgi:hypothetical protein
MAAQVVKSYPSADPGRPLTTLQKINLIQQVLDDSDFQVSGTV